MRLFHIHRDPNWQRRGANAYHLCACGARKVRAVSAGYSPVDKTWPPLVTKNGMPCRNTGWKRRNENGEWVRA